MTFQCSSASRKFLNAMSGWGAALRIRLSVLFSEPKIPQLATRETSSAGDGALSVLFSEPKIPQSSAASSASVSTNAFQCSSASRKFLNPVAARVAAVRRAFQCSSASRKFLNFFDIVTDYREAVAPFSALQRAENSSIQKRQTPPPRASPFSALQRAENSSMDIDVFIYSPSVGTFQCSSASRKFLNRRDGVPVQAFTTTFSALQRAENSSM